MHKHRHILKRGAQREVFSLSVELGCNAGDWNSRVPGRGAPGGVSQLLGSKGMRMLHWEHVSRLQPLALRVVLAICNAQQENGIFTMGHISSLEHGWRGCHLDPES